jgi:hypothetical protein
MVGLDFCNFSLNCRVVLRKSSQTAERAKCLVRTVLFDVEAGSLWEDQQTTAENDGPSELNGDWNAVAARVIAILRGVVHDGGKEET